MTARARRSTRLGWLAAAALLVACNGASDSGTGSGGTGTGGKGSGGTAGATTGSGGTSVGTGGSGTGGGSGGTGSGGNAKGGAPGGAGGSAPGGAAGGTTSGSGGQAGRGGAGNPDGGPGGGGGRAVPDGAAGAAGGGGRGGAGGQGGSQPDIDGGSTPGTACASPLPAITDYAAAAGPFPTSTENNTGPDKKCVIYRPKTLGENGFLHPQIVFGPGINMQATQLSGLLTSFASHGYVVIGTGVLTGGPNDPGNLSQMKNALDWIIKQNTTAGAYEGKLATKCAVAMGYSVGGTAAVELGSHEAVATVVSIHGHTATAALHGTMLQTSGDKDDVGRPMQQKTFDQSKVQTAFGTVSGADHGYIQSNNGGVQRPAIIAWMRYWLNGDTGGRSYFWGTSCVLCKSPWMDYKTKNWQ